MSNNENKKNTGLNTGCLTSILVVLFVMLVICVGGIGWKMIDIPSSNVENEEKQSEERQVADHIADEEYEMEDISEETDMEQESWDMQEVSGEETDNHTSDPVDNLQVHNNPSQQRNTNAYVLNTRTKKIHYQDCADVEKMIEENYSLSYESLDSLLQQEYTECGHCMK